MSKILILLPPYEEPQNPSSAPATIHLVSEWDTPWYWQWGWLRNRTANQEDNNA